MQQTIIEIEPMLSNNKERQSCLNEQHGELPLIYTAEVVNGGQRLPAGWATRIEWG